MIKRLPRIKKVRIQNFSIYEERPIVQIEIPNGIFCLAGANGLGKSSFLAAVNFGLTGIVPPASSKSDGSIQKFYTENLSSSEEYFNGRITESDRISADITIEFSLGHHSYKITRNLFESRSLRYLQILDENGIEISEEQPDDEARQQRYEQLIASDCRLKTFQQFVFIQHYLLTFDERRHLLFWDEKAITPLLYLAFDIDAGLAAEADRLIHEVSRADSQARNAQWQASNVRKRILELRKNDDRLPAPDLVEQYDLISEAISKSEIDLRQAEQTAADARIEFADASATYQSLRHRYDQAFISRIQANAAPRLHPIISEMLQNSKCAVCGQQDTALAAKLEARLEAHQCPLCEITLPQSVDGDNRLSELTDLDAELSRIDEAVRSARSKSERAEKDLENKKQAFRAAEVLMRTFEQEHDEAVMRITDKSRSNSEVQIFALEEAASEATARRDEWRKLRDKNREKLEPIQAELRSAFEQAQSNFVPRFRELSRQFIGLDLDVFLESSGRTLFQLGLEVRGSRRREVTALSESQRFFLDIALRMALVEQMTSAHDRTTIYIDTPEGSLDIAYEARAGAMFGEFVLGGNNMIMTANINANQLLVRLAERCGRQNMKLVRMTEWASLTEVQAAEEHLFEEAFQRIESALRSQ
jgi:DNA repair exonuclease SbcCD ATPase subunit